MTQQEFNMLSKKYVDCQATEEEEALLLTWLAAQPSRTETGLSEPQKQTLQRQLWRRIHHQIQPRILGMPTRQLAWLTGVAACVVLGYFGLKQVVLPHTSSPSVVNNRIKTPSGIDIHNTTLTEQSVKLKDGTLVWLKPNSSILYDKSFNLTKRTVYLKGEAFFKVHRDTNRPFIVHAGTLVTEVLGTSFRIKPRLTTGEIEVAVTTGRVSVYAQQPRLRAERNGVILTPNQRATFNLASQTIVPAIVEKPVPLFSAEVAKPDLMFQSASLQTVLNTLTQRYGIDFIVVNPKARTCQITADLTGLPLFTQLDLICKSIEATYEQRGTVVFITGDGC
ncbi:FecR family protein [Spirosoma areae]